MGDRGDSSSFRVVQKAAVYARVSARSNLTSHEEVSLFAVNCSGAFQGSSQRQEPLEAPAVLTNWHAERQAFRQRTPGGGRYLCENKDQEATALPGDPAAHLQQERR